MFPIASVAVVTPLGGPVLYQLIPNVPHASYCTNHDEFFFGGQIMMNIFAS
jgi:hypothetical protein